MRVAAQSLEGQIVYLIIKIKIIFVKMKCSDVIRFVDVFALSYVPSHKGNRYHQTIVGGMITILLTLWIASTFLEQMAIITFNPVYSSITTPTYFQSFSTMGEMSLDTQNQTVAVRLQKSSDSPTAGNLLEQYAPYFRVYFY